MADILSTLNNVTQCFATLQSASAHLMTKQRDEDSDFHLGRWYSNNQRSTVMETPAIQNQRKQASDQIRSRP